MPDPGQPDPRMYFTPGEGHRNGQGLAILLHGCDRQFIAGVTLVASNLMPLGINGLDKIALLVQ